MDSTGMKLHSENDVSGRAAEALVITLELHGKTDNTNVNHYVIDHSSPGPWRIQKRSKH